MTTMDSDSESQDSDDGRRFRFEATRKDSNARLSSNLNSNQASSQDRSQHSSRLSEDAHRSKKERSKHESSKREYRNSKDRDYDKDSRHLSKHSREPRSSRHDDYKNSRDSSISGSVSSKYKSRDSRRHRDRDRSDHHRERSRDRSQNGRTSVDKYKSKSYDKYKRHSRDRSREKSHQSEKPKLSDYSRSRAEQEKRDSHKRISMRETAEQGDKDDSPNVEKDESNDERKSETPECDNKMDTSVESQLCKDVNLSEFDVLSETDENLSDSSSVSCNKVRNKKRSSTVEYESRNSIESATNIEESYKVQVKKNDSMLASNYNNPSAVSDPLLDSTSSVISVMAENSENHDADRYKLESKEKLVQDSPDESSSIANNSKDFETDPELYGPVLPPQVSGATCAVPEKNPTFIGPCLPETLAPKVNSPSADDTTSNHSENDEDSAFGPVLPPHLRQKKPRDDMETKTIGPALPNTINLLISSDDDKMDSDVDDTFGPLPADHPALKDSLTHVQLEQRARRIRDEQRAENHDHSTQREEWMTELPPAQASNLGLGPRKFRTRAGPDMSDRSSWTDTPAQKAEKLKRREQEKEYNSTSNKESTKQQNPVQESGKSKKREKSLLEIHQKKLQKKKKKEEKEAQLSGHKERRPFDRDIDLNASRFDQAQKKTILKKAQLLDDRFSRGQI